MSKDQQGAAAATGRLLAELLGAPGAYRARWRRYAQRDRGTSLNQSAVSSVLAAYLQHSGQPELDGVTNRTIKDRVNRALSGHSISAETLGWFIDAFAISRNDQERLWSAFSVTHGERVELAPEEHTNEAGYPWRTVALQEHHYLGPNGIPREHHTRHVLVALQNGVDHYPFTFDTSEASVEVLRGGTAGVMQARDDGLYTVNIMYDQVLRRGDWAAFDYRVLFRYTEAPPTEFRRRVRGTLTSLLISIAFDAARLPLQIWWAEWTDHSTKSAIVHQEPVDLRTDRTVYRYLENVTDKVIGFHWKWPEGR